MATPHVVIIGGGFGGIAAARALKRAAVRVTLIDRRNHHLFQPLLYQVATAGLSAPDVAAPIRRMLRGHKNATVLLGEVSRIDVRARHVCLADGAILEYDELIVAAGAGNSWFGHDAWAQHAPGLKSLEDAIDVRRRVLLAFEAAEREADPAVQAQWLTFTVIGGGATGVELAGALAEIARHTLSRDFRHFDPGRSRVLLLEGGPRILQAFREDLSASAHRVLERLGVEVLLNTRVTDIDASGVSAVAADGSPCRIACRTVLWGAGVSASPVVKTLGVPVDRGGRVVVAPDLSIPGHPEVAVVGDAAAMTQPDGSLVPGVAQGAIQSGRLAAKNLLRRRAGLQTLAFKYFDKGSLATIGRSKAVAQLGRIHATGLVAWLLWVFVHIMYLANFRNRFVVLFDWAWAYVSYNRSARIILTDHADAKPLVAPPVVAPPVVALPVVALPVVAPPDASRESSGAARRPESDANVR